MRRLPRRYADALARGTTALSKPILWLCERFSTRPFAVFTLVLFLALFFINGVLGLDFGSHWDEWYHTQVVSASVQHMWLLPEAFSYGGPYFTFGYPVIIAHQWRNLLGILRDLRFQPSGMDPSAFPSVQQFKAGAAALFASPNYLLQVRGVFLGVTTLSIIWAFCGALRVWPRRYGVALAAAAFMAFSWELGYHARWVAIDAPLAQFCALELFLYCGAWRAPSEGPAVRWYCGAAAAAGAVYACKMTGGFALFPILLTPLLRPSRLTLARRLSLVALGAVIFVLVSFALSPDFYLDPLRFLHVVRGGSADYNSTGPTYPHYVTFGEHALRMLVWLIGAVPSPFRPIAFGFSAVALVGFLRLLRRETRMTLCWLSFMVTFAAIFTHNHLLIVRQFLMFVPFAALCFASGTAVLWDFLRDRDPRAAAAFAGLVALGMIANAVFESVQAWHVTRDTPASVADAAARDLLSERQPIRMSRPVQELLRGRLGDAYACHPADLKDDKVKNFLAYHIEHEWMANRLHSFRRVYGASELDLDYYSTWFGRSRPFRLVEVSVDVTKRLGRNMAVDVDCFPTGKPAPRPSAAH